MRTWTLNRGWKCAYHESQQFSMQCRLWKVPLNFMNCRISRMLWDAAEFDWSCISCITVKTTSAAVQYLIIIILLNCDTQRQNSTLNSICNITVILSRISLECQTNYVSVKYAHCSPSVVQHCWLGDRRGIWPVKSYVLVYWWRRFDWSFARLIAPSVTTASIILSSNKTG